MRWGLWGAPLLLLPSLGLSGCGLPPAVAIASYAADGASYVATGKTVTDHGLSAATGQDCAVIGHLVASKPICNDAANHGPAAPVELGKASEPRDPGGEPAAVKKRYVTVGSFLDPGNAERAAARYAALNAAVTSVEVHGKRFHRVVVGPLSEQDAAALKAQLAAGARAVQRSG